MSHPPRLEIFPLGGLGEFGMNLMVLRIGGDCLVVDAGLMFPGAEILGVDVALPDLSFLADCGTLHGVLVTHGHEDHVGALPDLLSRFDLPVYAPPHARTVVRRKLAARQMGALGRMSPLPSVEQPPIELGPFSVNSLPVSHSVPHSRLLVIDTPAGRVIHSGDLKLDPRGWGDGGTDPALLSRLGDGEVLALLSDSTNADCPGRTPGEVDLEPSLEAVVARAPRRVFVTLFSSNVERVARLARIAERLGRKLAVLGTSLRNQIEIAEELGLLRFPHGVRISPSEAMDRSPETALIVTTGSQAEPNASLAQLASGCHRDAEIVPGDLVIHSARRIPGNERPIGTMIDRLLRRGASVVENGVERVHVSGHASRDELRELVERIRPRFLVPIHGEYRHLRAHADLAVEAGLPSERVVLVETGDRVVIDAGEAKVDGRVPTGRVMVDPDRLSLAPELLDERRRAAGAGLLVPVIAMGHRDATPILEQIIARGFCHGGNGLLEEASRRVGRLLGEAEGAERADPDWVRSHVESGLRTFLRKRMRRDPLIVPLILEANG